jgi:hypothetical protein
MGKHLGSQLGKVEESALYDYPQKARIVKIKVNLSIEEPIRPGLFIGNTTDGITWVDFWYENLPMFCFTCGLVGHTEEKCSNTSMSLPEGSVNPRGPWLRSNIFGKRVNDKRDKRFNSNPMQSVSGGQFSPIPKAMIDMLAQMKLAEEEEEKEQAGVTAQNMNGSKNMPTEATMGLCTNSPTIPKRKFQKIQVGSHVLENSASSPDNQISLAGLKNNASQEP